MISTARRYLAVEIRFSELNGPVIQRKNATHCFPARPESKKMAAEWVLMPHRVSSAFCECEKKLVSRRECSYIFDLMTTAEVKDLSLSEKLQIMEAIWLDLRDHVDACPISPETRTLLDSRRERVVSGEAALRDWDEVKHSIGRP